MGLFFGDANPAFNSLSFANDGTLARIQKP